MRKVLLSVFSLVIVLGVMVPLESQAGQRRKVVVRPTRVMVRPTRVVVRKPVVPARLVVHRGHPIRRVLPNTVVIRPAHRVVAVGPPLVFMPRLVWAPRVVSMPSSDRLVWQDNESIDRDEGWVDTNFGVDDSGKALFLDLSGTTALNFAEVTFANGNVQVVDFNARAHSPGFYSLLDFSDGRRVKTVRILAKSEADSTKLTVYLSK
jgi:hypothetical protein